MPVESPGLQNHRVGMFNNKTYLYKRKSDNITPRVNPAAIDGNPLGEQIERLIHTRNDTPSINQTFNSNNSSMLHKVITLYALLNNTKILNKTQSSLPNGSNHTDLLLSQALAKIEERVNITTEFAGVTLAGGGVGGVMGGAKITANRTVRNDSNANNPYRYHKASAETSHRLRLPMNRVSPNAKPDMSDGAGQKTRGLNLPSATARESLTRSIRPRS